MQGRLSHLFCSCRFPIARKCESCKVRPESTILYRQSIPRWSMQLTPQRQPNEGQQKNISRRSMQLTPQRQPNDGQQKQLKAVNAAQATKTSKPTCSSRHKHAAGAVLPAALATGMANVATSLHDSMPQAQGYARLSQSKTVDALAQP